MAQYQAGMLVVYGKLGFMKSKPLVCRAFAENRRKSLYPSPLFYGFRRPQLYPTAKEGALRPVPRHSRRKPIWHASKRCDHVEKATEFQREAMSPDGCSLGGACLTRLLAWGKSRSSHLMPDWIKIAVLIGQNIGFVRLRFYYTHFKLCCWQSFFASIIGGTCNFEKHCLFFAYLTTKFI